MARVGPQRHRKQTKQESWKEGKWVSNFIVVVGLVETARPGIYRTELNILKVGPILFSISTAHI